MEGNNTFEKGLHRSNSPQLQPDGSYVDALNWIRNDSGRLTNEEAEEIIQSLTDAAFYTYLGSCPVKDSFIIFFQQKGFDGKLYSEIGMFENTTKTYRRIFNDFFATYKLNFSGEIDSIAKINPNGEILVYFVEKNNKPRRFNITLFESLGSAQYSSEFYNSDEDWKLQLDFKMPYATYVVEKDGTLPSGSYSFAFRYVTDQNNKTTFNIPSRFINIAKYVPYDSYGNPIYNDEVVGGLPQSPTNQKIVMTLQNTDPNYPLIEVVVITYLGTVNQLSIRSLGTYENINNSKITFSTVDQYLKEITEKEILEMPVNINSAECIEQKDNVLVLSNITSRKFDKDFQKVANQIKIEFFIESRDVDIRRNITGVRKNAYNYSPSQGLYSLNWLQDEFTPGSIFWTETNKRYSHVAPNYSVDYGDAVKVSLYRPSESRDQNSQQSNVYGNPFVQKGFVRGEVYSFSITPIYKDGSLGFAYHIPGAITTAPNTNQLKAWYSNIDYPQLYKSSDPLENLSGKIRHHQMPDFNDDYFVIENLHGPGGTTVPTIVNKKVPYIGDDSYINILRIKVKNINFTPEQLQNIQGYIIGFQPRNNDINTRIIDSGFTRPYLKNEQRDQYINSAWTGQIIYTEDQSSNRSNWTWKPIWNVSPYAMYHSPDTLLQRDKIKTGYKIQTIGYGGNAIIHAGRPGTYVSQGQVAGFDDRWKTFTKYGNSPYYVKFLLPSCTNISAQVSEAPFYMNLFFEFNDYIPHKSEKHDIIDAIFIGAVGANNPTTIDGKINLKYSSEYIHLKTNGSHFYDSTRNYTTKKYHTDIIYQFDQFQGSTRWDSGRMFDPGYHSRWENDSSHRICVCLARVINETFEQYGRLENATYQVAAFELDDNGLSNEIDIEGDVYISKYFHNLYDEIHGDKDNEVITGHSMMGVYVESKNNYALRHADDGAVPFYPNYKYLVNSQQANYGLFNYEWWKVSTGYNKQYSSLSGLKLTFAKPLFFKEISEYSNRSVYSNQAFESELIDQYRIFKSDAFHDIPRDRGVIKDTFVFNNNFYHHTEYGLWLSYFNPNTTQATSQGDIVLGNAGIFRIPSKLVLDIKGGYMGTMDKSGTNTPFGRVFLDHKQGKVFLLTGESPMEISDLGLFSYFREFVNTDDKYCMGYDWVNKRLLLNNISKERAISFYPKTQTWTSFHNFSPRVYFTTNGYSYAFDEVITRFGFSGNFYNMNNSKDVRKSTNITFVENTQPDAFKRFDRIEINTMSGGRYLQGSNYLSSPGFVQENDHTFIEKSFEYIHCWTDRQNTTQLPFAYSHDYDTNFLKSYEVSKVPINYYRGSFHAELPLDAVVDPYKSIFDPNNTDINGEFRSHMKGKFLYTKLSYNDSDPLVLNYVKTSFKPSVA